MKKLTEVLDVFSNSYRIRLLCSLQNHKMCLCQMAALLDLPKPAVSEHLNILIEAGFIRSRNAGCVKYYLNAEIPDVSIKNYLIDILKTANTTQQILVDKDKFMAILKLPEGELCHQHAF